MEMGVAVHSPNTLALGLVWWKTRERQTMKAERTVRELEEVREREEEKSRQGGDGDCSLETGGRWKAEGLPFSWR